MTEETKVTELENLESSKNVSDVPVKKKRGRKKKIKTPEEIERELNKPKQRRGRKPKSHMIEKRDISEYINKKDEEETIILNLKIKNPSEKCNEALECQFNYNTKLINNSSIEYPSAYDNVNSFSSLPSNINKCNSIDKKENIMRNIDKKENIMNSIEKKNTHTCLEEFIENKKWIDNTNVLCWWCCHTFENKPFGLPIKYKNNKFSVTGCFCSLECVSSYNFNDNNNMLDVWECYSLINLLSQKLNYKNIIKLAPHKISLKIFGGKLDIEEFRNFTNSNRIINVLDYPMIATNQQLEEINYNTQNNMNNFIPIDENRLRKIEQKIKLSRSKPLNNNKNTLEHTMNLKMTT
tara:strand:- start:11321 stop:12373 length:1053 start_codon:yes stop_codon:yes gene_type:complete